MKQQILALAILTLTFASCKKEIKSETVTTAAAAGSNSTASDMHTSENALDWNGTYEGVIPCADCPGIETKLTLNGDKTYELSVLYQDREKQPTISKGTFSFDKSGNTITLDKAGNTTRYRVKEDGLVMLDADEKEIEGPLKTNYILNKKP